MNTFDVLFGIICVCGALGAVVGGLIGNIKGRPLAGAIWGFFLGPIGWVVILVAPDIRPTCPECRGVVVDGARKCQNCGTVLPSP